MPVKLNIPGSKSIANRMLAINYLCGGKSKIQNLPDCDDVNYMLQALEELKNPTPKIFTGNAGTATRFLTALATTQNKEITISGDERMQERPIKPLIDALNTLGASLQCPTGCPPIKINPQPLQGGTIKIPGDLSSQYISALLMVLPFATKDSTIEIEGDLCSKPYVDLTINILNQFGLKITNHDYKKFEIKGQQIPTPKETYIVEADASSASYPAAYAALHPETPVTLNITKDSLQGDIVFLDLLQKMGCKITETPNGTTIAGPKTLTPLETIDMNHCPDLVMTIAILALHAPGITRITNVQNLRIKECDRLEALHNEINKFAIFTKIGHDYIEITGTPQGVTTNQKIKTYNDHRIAMCFGLITPKQQIENPNCVNKSYKTFWQDLEQLKNTT